MTTTAVKDFYTEAFGTLCPELKLFLEDQSTNDIGHFNVFSIADMLCRKKGQMPYNRRTYYKISLINGKNHIEYADKVLDIEDRAILFATPKIPYRYVPQDSNQKGHFCVFTKEFMTKSKTGLLIDDLPIFKPNSDFIFQPLVFIFFTVGFYAERQAFK